MGAGNEVLATTNYQEILDFWTGGILNVFFKHQRYVVTIDNHVSFQAPEANTPPVQVGSLITSLNKIGTSSYEVEKLITSNWPSSGRVWVHVNTRFEGIGIVDAWKSFDYTPTNGENAPSITSIEFCGKLGANYQISVFNGYNEPTISF